MYVHPWSRRKKRDWGFCVSRLPLHYCRGSTVITVLWYTYLRNCMCYGVPSRTYLCLRLAQKKQQQQHTQHTATANTRQASVIRITITSALTGGIYCREGVRIQVVLVTLWLTSAGANVVLEVVALDPVDRNGRVECVVATLGCWFVGRLWAPVALDAHGAIAPS